MFSRSCWPSERVFFLSEKLQIGVHTVKKMSEFHTAEIIKLGDKEGDIEDGK